MVKMRMVMRVVNVEMSVEMVMLKGLVPLAFLFLFHIKTQGRRGNTNIGYSFLPLPYPVALRGTAHKIEAEAKGEYTSTSLLAVSRSIVGHGQGGGFN